MSPEPTREALEGSDRWQVLQFHRPPEEDDEQACPGLLEAPGGSGDSNREVVLKLLAQPQKEEKHHQKGKLSDRQLRRDLIEEDRQTS